MGKHRIGAMIVAMTVVVGASAGAAQAATRYAAPTAQGSGNCSSAANACTLPNAVAGSAQGDTVVVAGSEGAYSLAGTITDPAPDAPALIEGAPGQARPVISTSSDPGFELTGTATVGGQQQATAVSNLDIEELAASLPTALSVQGNVDHVIVRSLNDAGIACSPLGLPPPETEVISNSLCVAAGLNAKALGVVVSGNGSPQPLSITLRNDTAYASGSGARGISFSTSFSVMVSVTATNVIAHGGQADISANIATGGGATIALDHSNYATTSQGAGTTVTPAGSGTNQKTAPKFVSATDFHEAVGSPTIDAGITAPANGATDLDGNPRTIGASTDIGAYEAAEAPTVTPGSPTAVLTEATLNASVNPNFSATTVHAYVGTSTITETPLPAQSAGNGIAPVALAFSAPGLKPGTTYHFHFVATNAIGSTSSADQTFTTLSGGKLKFGPRKLKVHRGKVRVKLSCASSSPSCAGTLVLKGLGKTTFSIAPGTTRAISIKLNDKAADTLDAKGKLKVLATLKRSDAGPTAHAKLTLTL